jgi:hypothetical protein
LFHATNTTEDPDVKHRHKVWRLWHRCCECGKELEPSLAAERLETVEGRCCPGRPALLIEYELLNAPSWAEIVECYEPVKPAPEPKSRATRASKTPE